MSRRRAADDFATIRARLEELRREKQPEQPGPASRPNLPAPGTNPVGHRGPCACGLALFPEECDGSCKFL